METLTDLVAAEAGREAWGSGGDDDGDGNGGGGAASITSPAV